MSISIGEPGRACVVSTIQYGQGRIEVGFGDFILMPRHLWVDRRQGNNEGADSVDALE